MPFYQALRAHARDHVSTDLKRLFVTMLGMERMQIVNDKPGLEAPHLPVPYPQETKNA